MRKIIRFFKAINKKLRVIESEISAEESGQLFQLSDCDRKNSEQGGKK